MHDWQNISLKKAYKMTRVKSVQYIDQPILRVVLEVKALLQVK